MLDYIVYISLCERKCIKNDSAPPTPKKSNMLPSLPEWKTLYSGGRMGDMWDSENDDVSKPTKEKKYLQIDYALNCILSIIYYILYIIYYTLL